MDEFARAQLARKWQVQFKGVMLLHEFGSWKIRGRTDHMRLICPTSDLSAVILGITEEEKFGEEKFLSALSPARADNHNAPKCPCRAAVAGLRNRTALSLDSLSKEQMVCVMLKIATWEFESTGVTGHWRHWSLAANTTEPKQH
jgi:hypothetical protein